jgi:rhodanese-related sulfurtransferase
MGATVLHVDIRELTVSEVAARLGQPGFFVFDNNGHGRWQRSHVPGAKNLNPHLFQASDLPSDKTATLVFYCSGPG